MIKMKKHLKMTKLIFEIILAIVLIISGFAVYLYARSALSSQISLRPCHGYSEVGSFDQKISSEEDARQVALEYYKGIGYNFSLEDLTATKIGADWSVRLNILKIKKGQLCIDSANPPKCIGQELRFRGTLFGKTNILMEYQLPC